MSRVPWTRHDGDDIEAVVAMFISAEHPTAERITPSVGDGGIDVLVKTDKTRVYQVKKFSSPLTSGQKKQVEESVDRLRTDPRVKDLQVDEWHLVMPWDPTLESKKWLTDYVTGRGLPDPVWDGLTRCDLWASQHPNIVDYYLEGHGERIREMAWDIVHHLRLKDIRDEDVQKRDISRFAEELSATAAILSREDPFYRYGVHVDPQSKFPDKGDIREALTNVRPGLVCSTITGNNEMSVRLDVYAKNQVAHQLDPLKINVVMTALPGSAEATAIQDFIKFGSPLELPDGVSGASNLPGGLGGNFTDASLTVYPNTELPESERESRLVIFDAEDQQTDSLVVHGQYTTTGMATDQGVRGIESLLTDAHGILEVLLRFDVDEQTLGMGTRIRPPHGKLAVDVLPPLRFYGRMRAPNVLAVAPRFGPIPDGRNVLVERDKNVTDLWINVAEALSLIQERTAQRLHFPNLQDVDEDQIWEILRVGALLRGEPVTLNTGHLATDHDPAASDEAETMVWFLPWNITVQEGLIDLGYLAYAFSGSLYERAHEGPDGLYDVWSVDDGKVLMRTLSEEEQKALPDIPEPGGA